MVGKLVTCASWGYPMDTLDMRLIVKTYLDRRGVQEKRFKDNLPGQDWALSFLKRHNDVLAERICQNIRRARAAVSRDTINEYFNNLENSLEGVPPANIVNYDETNLTDALGRSKIITKRGTKYPERIMNSSKSATSIMYSAAANGTVLPTYIVYKAANMYGSWTVGGPKGALYNRSKTGWFDGHCFTDWFLTIALPYCKKLASWKKEGRKQPSIPKDVFPRLLRDLTSRISEKASENIKSGFEKCGITPLNRQRILDRLPVEESNNVDQGDDAQAQGIDESFTSILKEMRYGPGEQTRKRRKKVNVEPGKSVSGADFEKKDDQEECDRNDEIESDAGNQSENEADKSEVSNSDSYADTIIGDINNNTTKTVENRAPRNPFHGVIDVESDDIVINMWVVVDFSEDVIRKDSSKKKGEMKLYLGKVTDTLPYEEYTGSFLRPKSGSGGSLFVKPIIEDISDFYYHQVIGRTVNPEELRRGVLKFDADSNEW